MALFLLCPWRFFHFGVFQILQIFFAFSWKTLKYNVIVLQKIIDKINWCVEGVNENKGCTKKALKKPATTL